MKTIWAFMQNDGTINVLVCQHEGCDEQWQLTPPVKAPAEITSMCPKGHRYAARAMPYVPSEKRE